MIKLVTAVLFGTVFLAGCAMNPKEVSIRGPIHAVDKVDFLVDRTSYEENKIILNHEILNYALTIIRQAEEIIIVDMFLFNSIHNKNKKYPDLSGLISKELIKKKREGVKVYLITDEINTFYKSYKIVELEELRAAGITVIKTDMTMIKDSNLIYSFFWRIFIKSFGSGEEAGWLPNPFGGDAPPVNIRGYLKLLNLKANHRKVVLSEKKALVTSKNFHDASGYHSNIGFGVEGPIVEDIYESEKVAANFSGVKFDYKFKEVEKSCGKIKVRLLTEEQIGISILEMINSSQKGESLGLGIFYLGDRKVVNSLIKAAGRGVKIRIIFDSNVESFGIKKMGIPNRVVAWELYRKGDGKIEIKWYRTLKEQYHDKYIFNIKKDLLILIGGSANFTKRNLYGYNYETNLYVEAPLDSEFSITVLEDYKRLWENIGGIFTLPYETGVDESLIKYLLYRLQELTGISTY